MPAATMMEAPYSELDEGGQGSVPFLAGSWEYSEAIKTDSYTPGSSQQNFNAVEVTPGGFLRGVYINVAASGGSGGSPALNGDYPWAILQNLTLESIDGTPILYPMSGYYYYLISKYCRPWDGDPAKDPYNVAGTATNPQFRFRFYAESRLSLGVLPNTDARAQYRVRYVGDTAANIWSSQPGTLPTVTITTAVDQWAQPDMATLEGVPIAPNPEGLALQRFCSVQSGISLSSGATTVRSDRVGNLIRTLFLVVRSSGGARTDLGGDPIRFRLDNASIVVETRDKRDYEMDRFYDSDGGSGTMTTRPTGVYAWPRFIRPGAREGQMWLETQEAAYLRWELTGGAGGSAGTVDIITEDIAISAGQGGTPMAVPAHLLGL